MRITLFAALAVLLATACQPEGGAGAYTTTPGGNRYRIIEANPDGTPAATDQFAYFHVTLKTEGDSLLFDTREGDNPTPAVQIASQETDAEQLGPIEDVLRYLRAGETAQVRMNIEEFGNKPPGLEMDSVVIYEVELQEVVGEEEYNTRQQKILEERQAKVALIQARAPEMATFSEDVLNRYKSGELSDELQTTASGLKYIIHEEGDGKDAVPGRGVVVQYLGRLVETGEVFDQSFERGEGIPFVLGTGGVIPGWDEGIALLKEGATASFFIPSELGYGAQGSRGAIPPNAELYFYVELEQVQ